MLPKEIKIYWHRLRAMSAAEMTGRLGRDLAARWSRIRGEAAAPGLTELVSAALTADPGQAAVQLRDAAAKRRCLPFQLQEPAKLPVWFVSRMPDAYAGLLRAADAAVDRHFEIFSQTLDFAERMDWHFDPLAQRTMPLDHWTAIPYWRNGVCPGVKQIWELNRCQHFVTLGQAFRLSGDPRYARALLEQWQSWIDDNPPHLGINWTSALELGLRMISWSWALQLVKSSPLLTPEIYARILGSVHQQAGHIRGHLSRHSGANNHLLGECLGLIHAGCCFPELKGAAAWREKGFTLFFAEFERQIHADGVIKEQSTGYQRYLYDYGMLAVLAAERCGYAVPPVVLQRLERMAEFVAALMDEAGSLPCIGDGDDGQALLLDPAAAAGAPFRDLLGSAALRFERGDFKALSAGFSPALFWLFGAGGEELFARIPAATRANQPEPLQHELRFFPEGGYAVLRSGVGAQRQIGVLDAGPLGLDAMAAHGHADALNFLLTAGAAPLLIDSGTYAYRGEAAWRAYFRGAAAHNTVRIEEQDQSQIVGPFQWGRRANARFFAPKVTGERLSITGEHDGYRRFGVIHRRQVSAQEGFWLVEDDLLGSGRRRVELFWHLAPCQYKWIESSLLEADYGSCRMQIRVFGPDSLRLRVEEGALAPLQGWFSPHFAVKKANPVLCINTNEPLPLHISTEIRIEPLL